MTIHWVDCEPNWTEKKRHHIKLYCQYWCWVLISSVENIYSVFYFVVYQITFCCGGSVRQSKIHSFQHIYELVTKSSAHDLPSIYYTMCLRHIVHSRSGSRPFSFRHKSFLSSSLHIECEPKMNYFWVCLWTIQIVGLQTMLSLWTSKTKLNQCVYTRWISLAVVCWFGLFWLDLKTLACCFFSITVFI